MYATVQQTRDEILVIFWGQDKVMFPRAERVRAQLLAGTSDATHEID